MKAIDLIEKFGTRDPFEIAKRSGILVVAEPLGNVNGYFNVVMGQPFIHVNDQLPDYYQPYVVAHLLFRLLKNSEDTLFVKDRVRAEFVEGKNLANRFAFQLILGEAEFKKSGSAVEFMKKNGMSDADIDHFVDRLTRIVGEFPDVDSLFKLVLEQVLSS